MVARRRILLVCDLFRPVVGGTETHVESLARILARRGHDVAVATQHLPGTALVEDLDGIRVHRVRVWSRVLARAYEDRMYRHLPPLPDPGLAKGLRRVASTFRADVVHVHGLATFSAAAARLDAPVVATLHDHWATCVRRALTRRGERCSGPSLARCVSCSGRQYGQPRGAALTIAQRASMPALGRVDRYVAVSRSVADAFRLVSDRPVEVIPNFVDDDAMRDAAALPRPSWLPAGPYALFVGGLVREKGGDLLVDAYRRLPADVPPLVMVAPRSTVDVPDDPRLVVVPGAPRAEVLRAWRDATVGVVPSLVQDACPTVAIEAIRSGVPVVGTRVGGIPDIVADGETGVIVPPRDAAALAEALRGILLDAPRRDALAAAAAASGGAFTGDAVADRLEAVYAAVARGAA